MITHTVTFRLKDESSADAFLGQATKLATIAGVESFQVLQQVGKKNAFTHALSMNFGNQSAYDSYHHHPDHQRFVNEVWIPSVAEFIELDYIAV